ncbi:MAG: ribosome silencing factor [Fimbriimonadaceae bacterium]|nr:ribosome silencing factor [Fimbriimonadaceae bacterium]
MDSIHSPNQNVSSESAQKAALLTTFADDMKAERIETLDVRAKTSVADFFVICSGTSDTHIRAIADRVAEKMRETGQRALRSNTGGNMDGWVLYDYGDVVFHVFREDKRQFYDLESLWESMQADPNLI